MSAPDPSAPPAPLVVLTDRTQCASGDLPAVVKAAVEGGARWFVFREKDLARRERTDLYEAVLAVTRRRARVSVASDWIPGLPPSHGVHLSATERSTTDRLSRWASRRPPLLGRSCHSLDELRLAEAEGVSYAFASPVFATDSKPGYGPAIGLETLSRWCVATTVPVFALGGVTAANAGTCLAVGAAGVAVMGEIMRAADPRAVTAALVAATEPAGAAAGPSTNGERP